MFEDMTAQEAAVKTDDARKKKNKNISKNL